MFGFAAERFGNGYEVDIKIRSSSDKVSMQLLNVLVETELVSKDFLLCCQLNGMDFLQEINLKKPLGPICSSLK